MMKRALHFLSLVSLMLLMFGCGDDDNKVTSPIVIDTTKPTVTAFTMPATSTSTAVPVTSFTATDNAGVTGYLITTSSTAPAASAAGWSATPQTSFTFPATGTQTAYAWAKDAFGNVSLPASATVNVSTTGPPGPAAPVQGVVIDPSTGLPISGATVNVYAQPVATGNPVVATTTTDANGRFSVTGLTTGTTYYAQISGTGYAPVTFYNVAPTTSNLVLENAYPIPAAWQNQTATVGGTIRNASTNAGLPNMTVTLRPGVTNKTGIVTATATTNSTGVYSFSNLPAGSYTAEVTGNIGSTPIITSYFTLSAYPGSPSTNLSQDFAVTTPLSGGAGQFRIVLSWGNNPSDLDSHLTGPTATSGERFHTAYYAVDYPAGSATTNSAGYRTAGANTESFLDVDNTSHGQGDNGPETTTIVVPRVGTYRFYVDHFAGSGNISNSGAQVKVYKGDALIATFNPPAGATAVNDIWNVFTLEHTTTGDTITPVNTITPNGNTSTLAKPVSGSPIEDFILFKKRPKKVK